MGHGVVTGGHNHVVEPGGFMFVVCGGGGVVSNVWCLSYFVYIVYVVYVLHMVYIVHLLHVLMCVLVCGACGLISVCGYVYLWCVCGFGGVCGVSGDM